MPKIEFIIIIVFVNLDVIYIKYKLVRKSYFCLFV